MPLMSCCSSTLMSGHAWVAPGESLQLYEAVAFASCSCASPRLPCSLISSPRSLTRMFPYSGENPRPNGLRFGVTAMQGWRVKMEDAHLARVCLEEDEEEEEEGQVDRNGREEKGERVMKEGEKERKGPTALFGVFDGHGGSEVANYCAKHLEHVLVTSQAWKGGKREEGKGGRDVQGALKEAFLRLDGMLAGKEGQEELQEMLREEREGGKRPEPEVSLEEVAVQTGLSVGSIRAYVKEAWRRGQKAAQFHAVY